jgi:hypothetical protein
MHKKIIILLLLVIGVNFYSNSLYACNKPHKSTKAKSFLKTTKAIAKSDCCKSQNKDLGHDCNNKCNHHNCDCNTISQIVFYNQEEVKLVSNLNYTIQKRYFTYMPSFYKDIFISIWHPPKIA